METKVSLPAMWASYLLDSRTTNMPYADIVGAAQAIDHLHDVFIYPKIVACSTWAFSGTYAGRPCTLLSFTVQHKGLRP